MGAVTTAILAVIGGTIFVSIVRWIVRRYHTHRVLKRYGIPGPKPNFFDGHWRELRTKPTPEGFFESWLKKYGNVFGYYMGEVPYIVINDLELIKQVLIKDFVTYANRPDLYVNIDPLPKTVIFMKGKRWKEVRSILNPTFSTSKMKLLKTIFDKKVDIAVDNVRQKADKNELFDIYGMMQCLTLDVIADCALAMKTCSQKNPNDELLLAMKDFQKNADSPMILLGEMFPFLKTLFTFAMNHFTVQSNMISMVLENLEKVVAERYKNPNLRSIDILQLMLDTLNEDKNSLTKLTHGEILANAFVTLLAGVETTSTALGFTFYLLVKHQDIQERLFQEIDAAPDSSYATLQGLTYLGQVLDESLRVFPPVPRFVSRVSKEDQKLGSYTIPAGAVVQVPVWQLHHNPDLFPDPFQFNPDRFSPENKSSIKSMSYLPFGEGPRICLGMRFALLEAKLAIFRILKNFKLVPCEKTEENISLVSPTLVTNPANGVWMRAVPRDRV